MLYYRQKNEWTDLIAENPKIPGPRLGASEVIKYQWGNHCITRNNRMFPSVGVWNN